MAIDRPRIEAAIREILAAIGENPERDGLRDTPRRVGEAFGEYFAGVDQSPLVHLADSESLGDATGELVLLRDIEFRSMCEHHLLPFTGTAHVAYLPGTRIVGLGRIPRVVETIASRPQIQERLTELIADALVAGLDPRGVLVVVEASHGCVAARGARQAKSSTVTLASRGELADPVQRAEVITLIGESRL
ncbi:GTP cyclohydrolase I FolE [Humidisolicoccus flavus]|uniref:GTP cyclohydrolase I FolE n=1 Tax=Humidisolicoccus flavus TaxID=3111414 RepID=UPI00324DEB34